MSKSKQMAPRKIEPWEVILNDLGWKYDRENCGCSGVKKVYFLKDKIEMVVYPKQDKYVYKINGVAHSGLLSNLQPVQK